MQIKTILSSLVFGISTMSAAAAQNGLPLPGNGDAMPAAELRPQSQVFPADQVQRVAPSPVASTQAPTPGRSGGTAYGHLPLTVKDAKNRLVELRTALSVSPPHTLKDPINQLVEWLADSADAHIKMSNAFAKHDELKAQCAAEKQIGVKFSQLKRDAMLLKADLLIAQKRYPEALNPLVEIVLADPTSATGKTAYQRLKDLGFSHEAEASANSVAAPASAPAAKPASEGSVASPSVTPISSTGTQPASGAATQAGASATSGAAGVQETASKVVHSSVKTQPKLVSRPVAHAVVKPTLKVTSIAPKRRLH